jgi:hypothetical protein
MEDYRVNRYPYLSDRHENTRDATPNRANRDQQLENCEYQYWHEAKYGIQKERTEYGKAAKVPEECSHLRYSNSMLRILAQSHD